VEVGAGEVGIATSPVNQEVRVALRKITVVPATRRLVKLQWLWRPTVDREVLPGHIPRPSENAVGARWQLVQRYPTQEPLSVAFDAAGAQFAVATSDRLIRIYQTADQQLVKMVGPTPRFPTKMIWGPSTDRLVVAGRDYRLQGFDVNTGQAVFRRGPSEGPIDGLCWNADASRFATGSWAHEHMARVFNANGGLIQAFSHANRGAGALAYASSGNWLAIHPTGGDERGAVELLRVGKAPPELLAAPNGQLPERLAISPNEQWLAAGSHSEAISVWRLSDGKLMHSLSVPGGRLLGLEWSHDGTRLIAGIDDRAIVEFDMVAAEPVELARYAVPLLRQFAVAADEVSLAAIADNQETFVINRQTREVKPLAMHHREQIALAIRPTGNHETAVVGRDGALRLFDSEGRQLLHSRAARAASLSSVVWTADGERIVASSADQRLIVWSADGSQQASYALPVVQSHQAVAAWQQDQVLVASRDGKVRVVRAADGSVVDTWTCSERPLATVATRGEQAVVSDNENRVTLRDAQGKETSAFGVTFGRAAFATAISPQGDCIALRGGDRNLQFYNLQGEKLAECDRSRDRTVDLAWSPSGKQLATSNYNGEIDVWSRDGEFQTSLAPASGGRSNQLVWVDEDHLLSVGEDGCLRHWNVKLRQAEDVTVLLSGGAWARYSPGGKLLDAEGEQNELAYVAENDRGGLDLLSLAEFRTRLGLSATEPASTPTTPTNPSGDRTPAVESVELPTRELAKLEDAAIAESSGLAASARDDAFWTHNDDETSPHLYLIGRDGKTLARFDVATDKQNDWEDMCRFHGDDADYLLIGDIGDNFARRDDCRLLLIKEPNLTDLDQVPRKLEVEAEIPYRFEDERHHDCEALAVDVARNVALLISKELDESCTLYEVPLAVSAEPQVAKRVRELKLPLVTSMDISPDGQRLVVLGGLHAFEWTKANSESWTTAMQRLPHRYVLPKGKQLEAIAYRRDGRALLLTTEGEHTPLWELTLP
jgi:WD40 repeat protein